MKAFLAEKLPVDENGEDLPENFVAPRRTSQNEAAAARRRPFMPTDDCVKHIMKRVEQKSLLVIAWGAQPNEDSVKDLVEPSPAAHAVLTLSKAGERAKHFVRTVFELFEGMR